MKSLKLFKQVQVSSKTGSLNEMKEVITDGSISSIEKEIVKLKKLGVKKIETINSLKGFKTTYIRLLSGVNYAVKSEKLTKN
ncbi:hypothetical protein [Tenacibaculum piscium]|uniref:hypothetical protein n=1 Tax=Tenacibaculum piscium TaxID=1458515 RepID=UPI001F3DCC40|nr:hypothetical protein [Tenacibaculum piscium]